MSRLRMFSCWTSFPTCLSFSVSCWDFLWVLTSSLENVLDLVVWGWSWPCFSLLFMICWVLRWTSHCFSAAASSLSATSWLSRSLKVAIIRSQDTAWLSIWTWRWGSCSTDPRQQAWPRPRQAPEEICYCLRQPYCPDWYSADYLNINIKLDISTETSKLSYKPQLSPRRIRYLNISSILSNPLLLIFCWLHADLI